MLISNNRTTPAVPTPYLKLIRDILLVQREKSYELEALSNHVEGLVLGLGANGHLVGPNLQREEINTDS